VASMYRIALVAAVVLVSATAGQQPPTPAVFPPIAPNQARLAQTIGGLDGPGFALAYSEPAGTLAAGCEHGAILYWNGGVVRGARAGEGTPNALRGHEGPVTALAWGGGSVLASAGADRKIILWAMPDAKALHTLDAGNTVRALAMSPDGKLLASVGDNPAVRLWDVASGKPGPKLEGHTDWVLALAFSADGKLLASGGYDGVVRLWDAPGGKKLLDIPAKPQAPPNQPAGPVNIVWSLAFSPDGKLLAVGGSDAQIHLVNPADGKIVRSIPGHGSTVTGLAFHPAGQVLASASKDRTVRLWNPANSQPLTPKPLEGHLAWVQGVTFVAQGTRLASVGADQTLRVWDLTEPAKK
jgi:WD40 repeat protein